MISPTVNFWLYQVFFRYLWNLTFLWLHPMGVVAGAIFFDTLDYHFYQLTGKDRDFYDRADKAADATFYLAAAIYYFYFWRELWYAKIIAPFFAYRLLGNIIMIITLESWIPIVFPNIGETLMIFFSVLDYFPSHVPSHRRWDRWWKSHTGWTVTVVILLSVLKVVFEWVMWGDGNDPVNDLFCVSVFACWRILLIPITFFMLFVILATYWRHPNFEPSTVRYTKGGIPVKTKQKAKKLQTVEDALALNY